MTTGPGDRTFVLAAGGVGAAAGGLWLGSILAQVLAAGATLFDLAAFAVCCSLLCLIGRQLLSAAQAPRASLAAFAGLAAAWALLVVFGS